MFLRCYFEQLIFKTWVSLWLEHVIVTNQLLATVGFHFESVLLWFVNNSTNPQNHEFANNQFFVELLRCKSFDESRGAAVEIGSWIWLILIGQDGDDLYCPTAFQQFHHIIAWFYCPRLWLWSQPFDKAEESQCFGPKNPPKRIKHNSQELGMFTNLTACNVTCRTATGGMSRHVPKVVWHCRLAIL